MTKFFLATASALALAAASSPAAAQHTMPGMPGMTMPMPAKPAVKKKPATKRPAAAKAPAKKAPVKKATTAKAPAKAATPVPPAPEPMAPDMVMPPAAPAEPMAPGMVMPPEPPADHNGHTAASPPMAGMEGMAGMDHGGHAMRAAFGPYPVTREASGTAWQPDASEHEGVMTMAGDWMLMGHARLNLVYDSQSGPRGDHKAFVSGMLMGMAQRPFANGDTLEFKAMLSPDPLMGKAGYPLLLASGETANGTDRLIDRQHPHDLFMELSASYSKKLGEKASAFVYAGLPGEPAFGPPAFMHRQSILDSPEAPITHHWLDSTHITFGVVTAGLVLDRVKVEASRFNGREPDQYRYNFETGPLDSTSARISWNPTDRLSLQGSWAHLTDPEQLEPGVDQKRWSASGIYTVPMTRGWWSTTLAWGRKTVGAHRDDGFALESAVKWTDWTLFGRAEQVENRELVASVAEDAPAYRVAKASLGLIRDFKVAEHVKVGLGGLYAVNFVPRALKDDYGSRNPHGAMGFVRLAVQ